MAKQEKLYNKGWDCPCKEVVVKDAIMVIGADNRLQAVYNKECPEHGMKDLTDPDVAAIEKANVKQETKKHGDETSQDTK